MLVPTQQLQVGGNQGIMLSAPPCAQRSSDTILYFGPKRCAGWLMQRHPAFSAVLFVSHSFPTLTQNISGALSEHHAQAGRCSAPLRRNGPDQPDESGPFPNECQHRNRAAGVWGVWGRGLGRCTG